MFKDRLKEARINSGLKQSELGKQLGVSGNTISNWEKGVSRPDVDTVEQICCLLEISADFLFDTYKEILSLQEKDLLKKYRLLSEESKRRINHMVDYEYSQLKSGQNVYEADFAAFGGGPKKVVIDEERKQRIETLAAQAEQEQANKGDDWE